MKKFLKGLAVLVGLTGVYFIAYFGVRAYLDHRDTATAPAPSANITTPEPMPFGSNDRVASSGKDRTALSRAFYAICSQEITGNVGQAMENNSPDAQKIAACIAERVAGTTKRP